MARQVTSGSPSAFTTVAKVSDNTDANISYQWQIDGVDLVDGTAVPTKSEISSFFYSPSVRNASDRFSLPGDYGFSCGTISSKEAFVGPYVLKEGFRNGNRVEFDTPAFDTKYFSEFQVDTNWCDFLGFFGVADFEHLNIPRRNTVASSIGETSERLISGTNFNTNVGMRMAPWFGAPFDFLFGELTGTRFQRNPRFRSRDFVFVPGDIIGVVVNSDAKAVNLYKNGIYFCTLRNNRKAGTSGIPLYIFLQHRLAIVNDSENPSSSRDLRCTVLETPSSYSSNYYFPTEKLDQDPSVGTSGGQVEVSGAQTQTLTILSGIVSKYNLKCLISHPTASNSPIISDAVELDIIEPTRKNGLNFEYHPVKNGPVAKLEFVDLQDGDEYVIDRNTAYQNITFYSAGRDLEVDLEMFGSKGKSNGDYVGGSGGYSLIRFTIEKDTEYAIAGHYNGHFFVFKKSQLLAVVGTGGDAGTKGHGGDGGGVRNDGSGGRGAGTKFHTHGRTGFDGGGTGGVYIPPGFINQTDGMTGSSKNQPIDIEPRATGREGGRTIKCPIGNYWAQQGISPCEDLPPDERYRHGNGVIVTNSTGSIIRGWKAGTGGYRAVKGAGLNGGGDGGNGATGGQGGIDGAGGGGGSGYYDPVQVRELLRNVPGGAGQGNGARDNGRLIFRIVPPDLEGTFSHSFINSSNVTTSLTFSGCIADIEAEGETARDSWFSAAGNLNAKHYLITMNQQCSDIEISGISNRTAGGGPPWGDYGMRVALIQKINPDEYGNTRQFRVWFIRSSGANTYIRSCTITAVPAPRTAVPNSNLNSDGGITYFGSTL